MDERPLRGIRVVSLAVNLPGPLTAARYTALGAAVTKVVPPSGDPLAWVSPGVARCAPGRPGSRLAGPEVR